MPIQRSLELSPISDDEFQRIDAIVMRCAYAAHNRFGRMFEERVYENDVAARLRAEGLDVHTQVPIKVVYGGFVRNYYFDLVVNNMLYELKATPSLLPEHEMQALHYAMLQDVRLVKLINFGGDRVVGKLLTNVVLGASRFAPVLGSGGWRVLSAQCDYLVRLVKSLLTDLGTHLDVRMYNDVLVQSLGGELDCLKRATICVEGQMRGTHGVQFHGPQHAFVVTCFRAHQPNFQRHLEVLLQHVPGLSGVQWINFNQSRLEITTVTGPGDGRFS